MKVHDPKGGPNTLGGVLRLAWSGPNPNNGKNHILEFVTTDILVNPSLLMALSLQPLTLAMAQKFKPVAIDASFNLI